MEIKFLQTFKAIVDCGSFSEAAVRQNCTQSTVTFQIRVLEQQLGCKLFEKCGRKMMLTEKAKEILPLVDSVLAQYSTLLESCRLPSLLEGKLQIACPESLLTYRLQPILKAFRLKAPKVTLQMEIMNCYKIRDRVLAGDFDIGIHYDVGSYDESIEKEVLQEFQLVLVGSPLLGEEKNSFLAIGKKIPVCLVTNDFNSRYYKLFCDYLAKRDLKLTDTLKIGGMEAAKRSAASNLGVLYAPKFLVQKDLEEGSLIEIPTHLEKETINAVMVTHRKRVITASKKLFLDLTRELF